MKNIFRIISLVIVLSSCSGSKFLNRKYTSGRFVESSKTVNHNTFFLDSTKGYSSLAKHIELKKSMPVLTSICDKEIIDVKVNSILKKDSVFIIDKRGKNKIIIQKNNMPNVILHIDYRGNLIKTKSLTSIQLKEIKKAYEIKIKIIAILSLIFSLIPVFGLVISCTAKKLIKQNKKDYPLDTFNAYNTLSNIAIGLSIIPALFGFLLAVVLLTALFMLLFGGGALVVIM